MTAGHRSKVDQSNKKKNAPERQKEPEEEISFLKRIFLNPMIEGVRWTERYSDSIEKFWLKLPNFVTTIIATFAVFTFGSTLRGIFCENRLIL